MCRSSSEAFAIGESTGFVALVELHRHRNTRLEKLARSHSSTFLLAKTAPVDKRKVGVVDKVLNPTSSRTIPDFGTSEATTSAVDSSGPKWVYSWPAFAKAYR